MTQHKKGSLYSITERRVPEPIPVLGSQPAGDVSHKPVGRLPLLSARPAVDPRNPYEGCYQFCCLVNTGTMGVNSLPKTVTRQRRGCDLNPGPSAPKFSTLTTRLPSHPTYTSTQHDSTYTSLFARAAALQSLVYHTHPFNGLFSRTTQVSRYQKGKTSLDLNEARDDGVSGISWTICKQSAPCSRHVTTPTPHHSICTGRMLCLMPNKQRQSTSSCSSVLNCLHIG